MLPMNLKKILNLRGDIEQMTEQEKLREFYSPEVMEKFKKNQLSSKLVEKLKQWGLWK